MHEISMISNVVFCGHILLNKCTYAYLFIWNSLWHTFIQTMCQALCSTQVLKIPALKEFSGEAKCKQNKYDINTST